jgi:succinate dehydrogenase/fumarate reductase flavoprotein subunit
MYSGEEWLGAAPEIDAAQIKKKMQTDIIVIGGGLAGVAAARRAVELGARVVLFEKCTGIQARSGDFAVLDSKATGRWGRVAIDKTAMVADLMRDMAYKASQDILMRWTEEAGTAFDWYLEAVPGGVPVLNTTFDPPPKNCACWVQPRRLPLPEGFDNAQEHYKCYQTTAWVRPTHILVCQANYAAAEQSGLLTAFFSAPVRKLLRTGEGRVEGVIAESEDGYIQAAASRGVILATGDYMNDPAMLRRFLPGYADTPKMWTSYDKERRPSNTGDGHRLGLWIGAKLQEQPHAACAHHMGSVFGVNSFLLLNSRGRRFVNEDAPGQQLGSQIENLPEKTAWQFVDGNWRSWVPHGYPSHGCVCYVLDDECLRSGQVYKKLSTIDNIVTPDLVERAVTAGKLLREDSLEALVRKTGLPEQTALNEIQRYNTLCLQGKDTDFGKTPYRLFPLARPPFYAARFTPATMIAAMGGLQSDADARCYDVKGRVIPGLYLAGNVQGNRIAVDYPLTVPGLSHSLALTYGRIAAQSAAGGL